MRKKLAVYFTFPFPDYATIRPFLASINSELVDYVELGIPVKNPYYDGPKIRTTHGSSIEHFKLGKYPCSVDVVISKLSLTELRDLRSCGSNHFDFFITY